MNPDSLTIRSSGCDHASDEDTQSGYSSLNTPELEKGFTFDEEEARLKKSKPKARRFPRLFAHAKARHVGLSSG